MKKTITALMALAGVAAADTEKTVDITTSLMPTTTPTWCGEGTGTPMDLKWNPTFSGNAASEAATLTTVFKNLSIASSGYYAFNQYGSGKNSGGVSLTDGTLTINGPSGDGSGSMFFVAVVTVEDILKGNDFESLNNITLTLTGNSGSCVDSWFSVYSMDTTNTLTTILELAVNDSSSLKSWSGSKSYTINADSLEATDKLVLFVRHNDDISKVTADTLQFTGLKATANLTVPEPTTATLSLLALAGLAARRRRK